MKNFPQKTRGGENPPHEGSDAPSSPGDSIAMRYPPHEVSHAMRALFDALPSARTDDRGRIDFSATSPAVLAIVADYAEITATGIGLGLSAVGNLIPYAAPEMGDGTVSSDTIEALGWLITELGDTAAACLVLATSCRRQCAASAGTGSGTTPPDAPGRHNGEQRAASR